MSDEAKVAKTRAVWGLGEEQMLLELYQKAREDHLARTERGIRPRAWVHMTEELNNRCKTHFVVDQVKSKYSRLMQDYELFKGAGQESSLTDKELDKLISENPKYALRFPQFPHFEMCCHISAGRKLEPRKRLRRMKKAAANRPTGRKSPSKSPQSRQSQQSNRAPETK